MNQRPPMVWRGLAALVTIVVVGGTIYAFARVRICDDQLTGDGEVVSVCRHMEATDPPVLAAGLVLLVALGAFFNEISGFGISLKQDLRAVRQTAEEARDQAQQAQAATETFEETASDLAEGVEHALTMGKPSAPTEKGVPQNDLDVLAEEYNRLRWTMRSGNERTALMTEVVHRMIDQARSLSGLDLEGYLRTNNAGRRLAAYAYVTAHPDRAHAHALADAFLTDDKPFNQYWALKALDALDVPISEVLRPEVLRELRARLPRLEGDASRHRLLTKLLAES